jgi:hypothetical protein
MLGLRKTLKKITPCAAFLLVSLGVESTICANVGVQSSRAHRHSRFEDLREEILPDVEIVEVVLDKSAKKEHLVRSPDKRYEAFTSYPIFTIYYLESSTGRVYEVRGLPLPHRPFSDLVWLNNRTLAFDRWSQPHYGIHYAVNVKEKKLVMASAFPDDFYLEQQGVKPRRKKQ